MRELLPSPLFFGFSVFRELGMRHENPLEVMHGGGGWNELKG